MKKPVKGRFILDFLDDRSSYEYVPYADVDRLYASLLFCAPGSVSSYNEVLTMDVEGNHDPCLLDFVFSTVPCHLPNFVNGNLGYVSYQPHQVRH